MEVSKQINFPQKLEVQQEKNNSGLQLSKISVNEEYAKKWNVDLNDFICLTKNGQLISNNLYRVGGLGKPNLEKDNYFMLIKYVEDIYDFDFIKKCYPNKSKKELELQRKHLKQRWVIIDKNGVEKYEHKGIDYPYLVKNSCIFSFSKRYYNIETGALYCQAYESVESADFIFLKNSFDDDKSKRGVMKVNKKDGSYELFPE